VEGLMAISIGRGRGHAALFDISGFVSNNVTWDENIYFTASGAGQELTGLAFQLQFRESPDGTSTVLDLTTADSELVITNDTNGDPTILRVNVPYTTINGMSGDYIADLVSKDDDDKLVHWGHGIVTFGQMPVAF
jgi:hypothetical protein